MVRELNIEKALGYRRTVQDTKVISNKWQRSSARTGQADDDQGYTCEINRSPSLIPSSKFDCDGLTQGNVHTPQAGTLTQEGVLPLQNAHVEVGFSLEKDPDSWTPQLPLVEDPEAWARQSWALYSCQDQLPLDKDLYVLTPEISDPEAWARQSLASQCFQAQSPLDKDLYVFASDLLNPDGCTGQSSTSQNFQDQLPLAEDQYVLAPGFLDPGAWARQCWAESDNQR